MSGTSQSRDGDVAYEADVCVVGAGPAGLVAASELARRSLRVVVVETGDLEHDPRAEALSVGTTVGDYPALEEMRARRLGGTAHTWAFEFAPGILGVRYVPLDAVDFEVREGVPGSGWPIAREDLDPFYERAHALLDIGPYDYSPGAGEREGRRRLPLTGGLSTGLFRFGPRSIFTRDLPEALRAHASVSVVTGATVTDIETNDARRQVTGLIARRLDGGTVRIRARAVVLAGGGIENARLLLASSAAPGGLANDHDLVGRHLMDHPLVRAGVLLPTDRHLASRMALYDVNPVDGTPVMAKLGIDAATMRSANLPNTSAILFPRDRTYRSPAVSALKDLARGGVRNPQLRRDLATVLRGADAIALRVARVARRRGGEEHGLDQGGWSRREGGVRGFDRFEVLQQTEQLPDPDNRVTLGDQLDEVGRPRAVVHWRWTEADRAGVIRAQTTLAHALAIGGTGTLSLARDGSDPELVLASTHHHIGTTRMSPDPRTGVVDPDCRVHDVVNLFVAGSSTFATSGFANPTLTIVAMAIRLADHIAGTITTLPETAGTSDEGTGRRARPGA